MRSGNGTPTRWSCRSASMPPSATRESLLRVTEDGYREAGRRIGGLGPAVFVPGRRLRPGVARPAGRGHPVTAPHIGAMATTRGVSWRRMSRSWPWQDSLGADKTDTTEHTDFAEAFRAAGIGAWDWFLGLRRWGSSMRTAMAGDGH